LDVKEVFKVRQRWKNFVGAALQMGKEMLEEGGGE
jgi:hypothetical protein